MLANYTPRPYQGYTTSRIIDTPFVGPFLDMGLGKTASSLDAICQLLFDFAEFDKVLVIAPKKVAEHTWPSEVKKWKQFSQLRVSVCIGTEKQRKMALMAKADVYTINRENVAWLVGMCGTAWPFKMVVIDESSSFKSHDSQRFKALRRVRPLIDRVVCLTGTPTGNKGLLDLWPQLYLLDKGERLGTSITKYREKFFNVGRTNGQVVFDYKLKEGSKEAIYKSIEDLCFTMKSEDYINLPERIDNDVSVFFSEELKKRYEDFERNLFMSLPDADISPVNAAALSTKLRQFAAGAVYDGEKNVHEIHKLKIEALEELLDTSAGQPVMVVYYYQHDRDRIMKYLKKYNPRLLKTPKDIDDWNSGEVPLMLIHPDSAGHGLNLQDGGHLLVWYSLTWSLETYQQVNKRLHRPGQDHAVIINRLILQGSIDEDIVKSLANNEDEQQALMNAIKVRQLKYKP